MRLPVHRLRVVPGVSYRRHAARGGAMGRAINPRLDSGAVVTHPHRHAGAEKVEFKQSVGKTPSANTAKDPPVKRAALTRKPSAA